MKVALYGLPCAGKTTLLEKISSFIKVIHGSNELKKINGDIFQKRKIFLEILKEETEFIIDGHYQFITSEYKDSVFTTEDKVFDVFMYLYQDPKVIYERLLSSEKNKKYIPENYKKIEEWQEEEMSALRSICHNADKDFYIIDDYKTGYENFVPFLKEVLKGYSNVEYAREIVSSIESQFGKDVSIFDGDKTLIPYDSSKRFLNFTTDIFDNNFYTGYQFYLQDKLVKPVLNLMDKEKILSSIEYTDIKHLLKKENSIIVSSGIKEIWEDVIGKELGIKTFAGKFISSETKYFIAKFLKNKHYNITAYGDSKNDLYMLNEACRGVLVVGEHLSRSLCYEEISSLDIYNLHNNLHVLNEDDSLSTKEFTEINGLIEITKSNSGIVGKRLAFAHFELGKKLSRYLINYDEKDTTIVSIERSGRFLADGLYMSFGGKFASYTKDSQELNKIESKNIVLVDGVINNGITMIELIKKIDKIKKGRNIIVLSNVISSDSISLFKAYKVVVTRISQNKFTGSKVKVQQGNIGPDTSDRLFNQL